MTKQEYFSSSREYNFADKRPFEDVEENATWSRVTASTYSANWTTTSSKYASLEDCGPSEYIFIFYAYYYGLMLLVTIIGVAGNTAVIR